MNNLEIYNQARSVPNEAVKTIKGGRLNGFSDINPMWRIKRLTELFGPCGIGWWYVIKNKHLAEGANGEWSAFVDIDLYYRWGEKLSNPIPGTGGSSFVSKEKTGLYTSDECYKMALTDAISVAAKAIGIGADVYFEKDRSKYTRVDTEDNKPAEPPREAERDTKFRCADCSKVLEPYPDKNGVMVSLRKHAQGSETRFGKVLCLECIEKNYAD